MTDSNTSQERAGDGPLDHWIAVFGLEMEIQEPEVTVRCDVQPGMLGPVSDGVRMGILATIADMAGGFVPNGPTTPTVDLRTQLTSPAPRTGSMVCRARPLRVGRRLIVSEIDISDHSGSTFAVARSTFRNQPMELTADPVGPPPPTPVAAFEDLLDARAVDKATIEVAPTPRLSNGTTIQGGAQAFIAELAAERLFPSGTAYVTDLHIDYLNALRVGPLRATAELLGTSGDSALVRVRVTDHGEDDRIVSHVTLWLLTVT